MPGSSTFLEQAELNATLRGQAFPSVTEVNVALYTADPKDDASGAELSDSGYSRQDSTQGDTLANAWSAPASEAGGGSESTNTKTIQFPAIADGPVTISHFALFDQSGNELYSGAFTTARDFKVGDIPIVSPGELSMIRR